MKLPLTVLMTGLLLTGCAKTNSNLGLTVIEYSAETQGKAADEMEAGQCPTLNGFINDYSVLRDQARVK